MVDRGTATLLWRHVLVRVFKFFIYEVKVDNCHRYVAMHTMQEESSSNQHQHHETRTNGYIEGREISQSRKPSIVDLGAAVFGMILPLFLQFGHAH